MVCGCVITINTYTSSSLVKLLKHKIVQSTLLTTTDSQNSADNTDVVLHIFTPKLFPTMDTYLCLTLNLNLIKARPLHDFKLQIQFTATRNDVEETYCSVFLNFDLQIYVFDQYQTLTTFEGIVRRSIKNRGRYLNSLCCKINFSLTFIRLKKNYSIKEHHE